MATVYLAQDLKHHRPVAVKILHAQLAANVGSDRFLREIEIAARLSHPHILTLIDSGSVERRETRDEGLAAGVSSPSSQL
jgi:serine/threonine-protein kinase